MLAPHPRDRRRHDRFWLAEGRVADWGPPVDDDRELFERTRRAVARRVETTAYMPAAEIAEARIVQTWLANHDPPGLELDPLPSPPALHAFVSR